MKAHSPISSSRPLRVLVASKFWYERGGLERVMFTEVRELEYREIEVAHFSTRHPDNVPSPWESYFAPYLELGRGEWRRRSDAAVAAVRMFRNRAASRLFARLLDDFRPDLVHAHGIHRQLSPSILFEAKRRQIPVVQSLHDAHHLCPADVLLRGERDVCAPRECGMLDYSPAVKHRCVRGSITASALSAAETGFQRMTRAYERTVDRFISPSRYLACLMQEGGWRIPIDVVPNGVDVPHAIERSDAGWFLVATRLSPEKRIDIALEAARLAGARIVVAGDGPCAAELMSRFPEVEFLGRVSSDEVKSLLVRCRAAVVTSVVPENAPMAVLEAMAVGTPVIAPALGGIPELIGDGVGGVLTPPGDPEVVAAAIRVFSDDPVLASRLGEAGRCRALSEFNSQRHVERILDSYRRTIGSMKGRG